MKVGREGQWQETHYDGIDHDVEANVVNRPVGNLALLLALRSGGFKDAAEDGHLFVCLFLNHPPLDVVARRHIHEHLVAILPQQVQHLLLHLVLQPQALLLPVPPAILLAPQDHAGDCAEGLVVCGCAELVRCQGVFQGAVEVADRELGLGEIVVGLHVVWRQRQADLAVGDDGVPVAELEAGHCAVGVERWVFGVGDDAARIW